MSKKILMSVSYGASEDALAADIGCIERAMQSAYPDWELRRAFTSERVRAAEARRGRVVPDPAEAIAQAKAEGAAQVAVAALLVSPGGEFEGAERAAQGLPVATPLLTDAADLDTLAAYYGDMRQTLGMPLLIMGHGHPANGNPAYLRLRARLPEGVYLGCLSGEPGLAQVMTELRRQPERADRNAAADVRRRTHAERHGGRRTGQLALAADAGGIRRALPADGRRAHGGRAANFRAEAADPSRLKEGRSFFGRFAAGGYSGRFAALKNARVADRERVDLSCIE